MIFLLIAVSDSCVGSGGNTGSGGPRSATRRGGKGGTTAGAGASGNAGRSRSPTPVSAQCGHISDSEGRVEQVFPSSLFVIITFRLF